MADIEQSSGPNQSQPEGEQKFTIQPWEKIGALVVVLLIFGYIAFAQYMNFWPFKISVVSVSTPTPTSTPTPDSFALPAGGWQTYRNEEYGFEFRYPHEWTLEETRKVSDKYTQIIVLYSSKDKPVIAGTDGMAFSIVSNLLPEEKILREKSMPFKYISIIIAGSRGYISQELQGTEGLYREALIPLGYETLIIHTSPLNLNQFDQILSTFKFIEPSGLHPDLLPLYSKLEWNEPRLTTYADYFDYEKIDPNSEPINKFLKGYQVDSISDSEPNDLFNYYLSKMEAADWTQDANVAADGPDGSRWGFVKNGKHIIFNYAKDNAGQYSISIFSEN